MTKRKTKAQREAEQKDALRQIVLAVACGASQGEAFDGEFCMAAPDLQWFMQGLSRIFEPQLHESSRVFKSLNWIEYFETVDQATDLLWRFGCRASKVKWEG